MESHQSRPTGSSGSSGANKNCANCSLRPAKQLRLLRSQVTPTLWAFCPFSLVPAAWVPYSSLQPSTQGLTTSILLTNARPPDISCSLLIPPATPPPIPRLDWSHPILTQAPPPVLTCAATRPSLRLPVPAQAQRPAAESGPWDTRTLGRPRGREGCRGQGYRP